MASYKVPQDVEADDKLLGPFTFRQFIYLIIISILCATVWWIFNVIPLLSIIPIPFIIFFSILALPIRKEQPMETYLAAIISFYLKPRTRFWTPGQSENTITISAPKKIEKPRTRNISNEEINNRLSFLANIIDSEGYAIYDNPTSSMSQDFLAEASNVTDIFDPNPSSNVNQILAKEEQEKRTEILNQMRSAFQNSTLNNISVTNTPNNHIVQPLSNISANTNSNNQSTDVKTLAHNTDYSVETIQKEANRISQKNLNANLNKDEVFIPLH